MLLHPFRPLFALFLFVGATCSAAPAAGRLPIFPKPQAMTLSDARFRLTGDVTVVLPDRASKDDLSLSGFLINELSDRYDLQLQTQRVNELPAGRRIILMGSVANPLVRAYCVQHRIDLTGLKHEGYVLRINRDIVLIAGSDDRGAFYGLQSLRQLIRKSGNSIEIQGVHVRDWPDKAFRGFKLYLPGRSNIPFFKRFVRDVLALYKYNKLIMEMNACMRLDRHPELNAGWVELARDTNFSRRNNPPGNPHQLEQNSSHHDAADGGFIEKEEVADLVRWTERNHIEMIPEIPSLTHSYYLLSRHKDLSEVPGEKWPDTYCPLNPKSHELLFDVFDEYIDVMRPRMVHIGHDEWVAPMDQCPRCKGRDPGELFAADLRETHDYLAKRGIRIAIWGDLLLNRMLLNGPVPFKRVTPTGWAYNFPGGMTRLQVQKLVPQDILIFNWYWGIKQWEGSVINAEDFERELDEMGFTQIYGNLSTRIEKYEERSKRVIGGAPSSWAATTEFNFGKDMLFDTLGCANLLWSRQALPHKEIASVVQAYMPEIRERLRGELPPSETGDPVAPVDISASFNTRGQGASLEFDLSGMQTGKLTAGAKVFELGACASDNCAIVVGSEGKERNPLPREVAGIRIGEDATSILFLHACARPATNKEAYRTIWDFDDTADLLGWYEVVYEDGLAETIPIRYGVNILEWNWGRRLDTRSRSYCYGADAIECSARAESPITFFALEWKSPRLGKVIREIRLKGSTAFRGGVQGFENAFGAVIPSNAVILKAVSVVKRRNP